jgi:hypothetical protein
MIKKILKRLLRKIVIEIISENINAYGVLRNQIRNCLPSQISIPDPAGYVTGIILRDLESYGPLSKSMQTEKQGLDSQGLCSKAEVDQLISEDQPRPVEPEGKKHD